jgi:hypothetical protein
LTGIPALLADLHVDDLAELRDQWRHAATNQSRDEARRLLFYFLVDAVDDERVRRAIAQDAPTTESTEANDEVPTSTLKRLLVSRS